MLIIFAAILAIMSNSVQQGGFWGDLSAFGTAIMMAISFTLTRRHKEINMVPAMALSGMIAVIISTPVILSIGGTFALVPKAIPYLIIAGVIVTLAFALITLGPRYIPAPEVSLIMPLETVLGSKFGLYF